MSNISKQQHSLIASIHFTIWILMYFSFGQNTYLNEFFTFLFITFRIFAMENNQIIVCNSWMHFLSFYLSKWLSIIQKRNQAKWTLIIVLHFFIVVCLWFGCRCKNCLNYLSILCVSMLWRMKNWCIYIFKNYIRLCLAFLLQYCVSVPVSFLFFVFIVHLYHCVYYMLRPKLLISHFPFIIVGIFNVFIEIAIMQYFDGNARN